MLSVGRLPFMLGEGKDGVEVVEDEELDEDELEDVLSESESEDCSEWTTVSK